LEIRIDGEPGLLSLKPDASVTRLLEQIENTLTASGRISTSYLYNGEKLTSSLLQASWDNQAPHGLLNIDTTPLKSHLLDLLSQLSIGVSESNRQLVSITEAIVRQDSSIAESQLAQWCIDISKACSNLSEMITLLHLELNSTYVDGESFSELFSRITENCHQALTLLRQKDKEKCADLIKNTMDPDTAKLNRCITIIIEGITESLP
jgi:hypothetical protein